MTRYSRHQIAFFEWSVLVVFGLTLILLAAPRLAAEYHRLGAAPTVRSITENKGKITESDIMVAAEKLAKASFYTPQNRVLFNNQATIELSLYEIFKSRSNNDKTFAALFQAKNNLQKALKVAPGDANLWYLLADIRARLSGADKKALDYLRISYLTGPREGWVARRRLGLSLRLWPLLPEETQKMVRREIRTLWSLGAYHRDLAWICLRAVAEGREIILIEVSRKSESERTKFLKLANWLNKSS